MILDFSSREVRGCAPFCYVQRWQARECGSLLGFVICQYLSSLNFTLVISLRYKASYSLHFSICSQLEKSMANRNRVPSLFYLTVVGFVNISKVIALHQIPRRRRAAMPVHSLYVLPPHREKYFIITYWNPVQFIHHWTTAAHSTVSNPNDSTAGTDAFCRSPAWPQLHSQAKANAIEGVIQAAP